MFNQASKEEINSFLARCRKLVYDGQLQLLPRVNLRELTRYGLMIEDVEDTITELSSENYFRVRKMIMIWMNMGLAIFGNLRKILIIEDFI